MKKTLRFSGALVALSVAAAGCTNENLLQDLDSCPGRAVGVNVYVPTATRGTALNSSADLQAAANGFDLFAFDYDSSTGSSTWFMGSESNGVGFIYSSGRWDYEVPAEKKYWEQINTKKAFFAVYPRLKSVSGLSVEFPYSNQVSYVVPDNCSDQVDVMCAKSLEYDKNDHPSSVELKFVHILSQIVFNGKIRDDSKSAITSVKVNSIELQGVNSSIVRYNFPSTGESTAINIGSSQATASPAKNYNVAFTSDFSAGEKLILNSTSENTALSDSECALFLVPQTLTSGTKLLVNAIVNLAEGPSVNLNQEVSIPTSAWENNKKYSYTIVFSTDKINPIFIGDADVKSWEDVSSEIVIIK